MLYRISKENKNCEHTWDIEPDSLYRMTMHETAAGPDRADFQIGVLRCRKDIKS